MEVGKLDGDRRRPPCRRESTMRPLGPKSRSVVRPLGRGSSPGPVRAPLPLPFTLWTRVQTLHSSQEAPPCLAPSSSSPAAAPGFAPVSGGLDPSGAGDHPALDTATPAHLELPAPEPLGARVSVASRLRAKPRGSSVSQPSTPPRRGGSLSNPLIKGGAKTLTSDRASQKEKTTIINCPRNRSNPG